MVAAAAATLPPWLKICLVPEKSENDHALIYQLLGPGDVTVVAGDMDMFIYSIETASPDVRLINLSAQGVAVPRCPMFSNEAIHLHSRAAQKASVKADVLEGTKRHLDMKLAQAKQALAEKVYFLLGFFVVFSRLLI